MVESIRTFPAGNKPPSWNCVESLLKRIMPDSMRLKVGEELSLVVGGPNSLNLDLDKPLPVGIHFKVDCALKPQFSVSLMKRKSEGRGYLIDALNDIIQADGEQEVLRLKEVDSLWYVIHHHEYYVDISSPARRVKGEKKLMLFLAAAFAGATNGYVYVTEPGFFGIPFGMYDFDSIYKVISQNT